MNIGGCRIEIDEYAGSRRYSAQIPNGILRKNDKNRKSG